MVGNTKGKERIGIASMDQEEDNPTKIRKIMVLKNIMFGSILTLVLVFLVIVIFTFNIELPTVFSGLESNNLEYYNTVYLLFGIFSIALIVISLICYKLAMKQPEVEKVGIEKKK